MRKEGVENRKSTSRFATWSCHFLWEKKQFTRGRKTNAWGIKAQKKDLADLHQDDLKNRLICTRTSWRICRVLISLSPKKQRRPVPSLLYKSLFYATKSFCSWLPTWRLMHFRQYLNVHLLTLYSYPIFDENLCNKKIFLIRGDFAKCVVFNFFNDLLSRFPSRSLSSCRSILKISDILLFLI